MTLCSDGYVAEGCSGMLWCSFSTLQRSAFGRDDFELDSFENRGELVYEIPRAETVFVDVFGGIDAMERHANALLIPECGSCDSLFTGHAWTVISGDEGELAMPLHKDFATLSLVLKGVDASELPFRFVVKGSVDGYCIPGGEPHKGRFECEPVFDGTDTFSLRLPRQPDADLMLELTDLEHGATVIEYRLGRLIAETGFDWSAPDLGDIRLFLTMTELTFTISIEGWDKTENINVNL